MTHHDHHSNKPQHGSRRIGPIHHRWWFWAAVLLMLGAMAIYVATMDEALAPGNNGQQVPAADL